MGRYAAYDLQFRGRRLDLQEGKGSVTASYEGEKESASFDAVKIGPRSVKGVVVEGE